ncbi:hypothetical protein TNIN_454261 [Trichonephila inaurata madagascariensis]|uniref:Uncharacterized protein n=1 Tax=Trichonephila inaurata madagascariensis TaxID=2747483 RepID=A0A8X6XWY9_9ARAC|nr:hypothetical protein TNIN_454261 [Trichonephila inaurata madagascariensis]
MYCRFHSELSSDHNPVDSISPELQNFEMPPPQLNTTWEYFSLISLPTPIISNSPLQILPRVDSQVNHLTNEILNAHAELPLNSFYHTGSHMFRVSSKILSKNVIKLGKPGNSQTPAPQAELNRLQNKIKEKSTTTDPTSMGG